MTVQPIASNAEKEQLAIIGAGFGRTATDSLKLALNALGYKCYHMHELIDHNDYDIWCKMLDTPKKDRDWNKSVFTARDYTATVDWPTAIFYKDLLKENPSAKVILTVRDSPEAWYKSARNSIYALNKARQCWQFKLLRMFDMTLKKKQKLLDIIWKDIFDGTRFEDKEFAINIYNKHIEDVKKSVPSEQLLIFNVKQGWEPLCTFLGVDVPKDLDFPRGNTTKDKQVWMEGILKKKNQVTATVVMIVAIIIGWIVFGFYK